MISIVVYKFYLYYVPDSDREEKPTVEKFVIRRQVLPKYISRLVLGKARNINKLKLVLAKQE